jgi:hypothetical protein
MPERNDQKLGFNVSDRLPSQSQEEAPPFGDGKSQFTPAFPPRPQNMNRARAISRILSPQGYPESTFRTLMKILTNR